LAFSHETNLNDRLVPAAKSSVITNSRFGASVETSVGNVPESALAQSTQPENDVTPVWTQTQPIGIYSHSGILSSDVRGDEDVVASTWLSSPLIEDLAGKSGKSLWQIESTDNALQMEVASAREGKTVVSCQWSADGYNMSGVLSVSSGDSGKQLWTKKIDGAGAGYGAIAINRDGSKFAIVANVNNSFVIPGHAQLQCYDRASSTPVHVIDLPAGNYAAQAATTMSSNNRVAFAAGTSVFIADCSSGKMLYTYNRNYIATALAMSDDGKYVATAFESLLVFGQTTESSYDIVLNEVLTSGNATSPGIWIGSQVAFSRNDKVAVGTYNGATAKQNRIVVYDLVKKNVSWTYDYLPVDFQQCQDTPAAMEFTDDSDFLVVGSWGDQNHTNPTVTLFCAMCGKVMLGYHTPGSVMTVSTSSTPEGVLVVAGGKHVHANLMGSGGDLFALEFIHKKPMGACHGLDTAAPIVNEAEIARLNALPAMSWTAGANERFAGMTHGDAVKMMGTILDETKIKAAGIPTESHVFEEVDLLDTPIPAEFSSAKAFPGCVHPVRDQASCGSCWAFGASEALSDRVCVAAAAKGKNISVVLSSEEMVSCDTQDYGCGGGFLYYAWEFMTSSGLVADTCFPYTAGGGQAAPCTSTCADGSKWTPYKIKNGTLSYYGSEEQIQHAVMAGGPIEVAFNVYADFMSYKDGVYQRTPGSGLMGGHAVKLVGWGHDQASGLDYWEIVNSWGTSWGRNGTFLIRRGVNECGIEYNSIWGDVDL